MREWSDERRATHTPPAAAVPAPRGHRCRPNSRRTCGGWCSAARNWPGWSIDEPAASVRLLIPPDVGTAGDPHVDRQPVRARRSSRPDPDDDPRRLRPDTACELTIDVALHDRGAASDWARRATSAIRLRFRGRPAGTPSTLTARLVSTGRRRDRATSDRPAARGAARSARCG